MGTVRSDPDSHAMVSTRSVDFPDPSLPRNAIATPPLGTIRPSGRRERARPRERFLATTHSARHDLRHLAPPRRYSRWLWTTGTAQRRNSLTLVNDGPPATISETQDGPAA